MKLIRSIIAVLGLFISLSLGEKTWACPDIDALVDVNCDGKLVFFFYGDSITYGLRDIAVGLNGKPLGYPGRLKASTWPLAP